MASELLVRVIYYDLSEWRGKTEEFCLSPYKGILAASIIYPDGYRHLLSGRDFYYIRDRECTHFNGEETETTVVSLLGYGKEIIEVVPVKSLDWACLRMGIWVDDRTMRIANKRILEVEE